MTAENEHDSLEENIKQGTKEHMSTQKERIENMEGGRGIKETLEILEFLEEAASKGIEVTKDGVQPMSDLTSVLSDSDLRQKFMTAFSGVKDVPEEVEDLQPEEIRELVHAATDVVFNILRDVQKA